MRRFVFELQRVLDARERSERDARRVLAEAERSVREQERRLAEVQGHLSRGRADVRTALSAGVVSIGEVRIQAQAGIGLQAEARRVFVELRAAHRRRDAARLALVEASAARRSLELLRERRLDEWRRAVRREDDRACDEIATTRFAREGG